MSGTATATDGTGNRAGAGTQSSSGAGRLGTVVLSLDPSSVAGSSKQRTTVALTATPAGPDLGSWTVDVSYDPKAVTVVTCSPSAGSICNVSYAPGVVRIAGASAGGLRGSQNLATLTLERAGRGGPSPLRLEAITLADTEGAPLAVR